MFGRYVPAPRTDKQKVGRLVQHVQARTGFETRRVVGLICLAANWEGVVLSHLHTVSPTWPRARVWIGREGDKSTDTIRLLRYLFLCQSAITCILIRATYSTVGCTHKCTHL